MRVPGTVLSPSPVTPTRMAQPRARRPPGAMVWIGVALAAIFWVLESAVHFVLFGGHRFVLLPTGSNELWMRLLICGLLIAFGIYAQVSIQRVERAREEQAALQRRLEEALAKVLSGFIPICAQCKRIRDQGGHWIAVEIYVRDRTEADFTHGICPDCLQRLYGEYREAG